MDVTVDWDLCIGSGLCVAAAGDAFNLVETEGTGRGGAAGPLHDPERLLAAARACPTLAIRLSRGGTPVFPPPDGDGLG